MRRRHRWSSPVAGLLAATVVLLGSACEAPLKPESQRSASSSITPAPTTVDEDAVTPITPAPPTAPPTAPTVPDITVPPLKTVPTPTAPPADARITGGDVSWPQCPKGMGIPQKRSQGSPMPLDSARFVVIGLTNGPGFTPNPCLADQTRWVRERKLMAAAYSVISYPDARTLEQLGGQGPFEKKSKHGRLSNIGYQQALFNLDTLRKAELRTPIVWLDVEPVPMFEWSKDTRANAAVVRGAARGYTDAGFAIGTYSTQALWKRVVGDLVLGIPEWRAAGQTSMAEALRRCGPDRMFQGGRPVISQWVEDGRDRNVTCPGTAAEMTRWFHQY